MADAVFVKVSLVLVAVSFQLHILTMAISEYRTVPLHHEPDAKDGTVKALLILAYALLIISLSLLLLINYHAIKVGKISVIVTSLIIFLAVLAIVMSLAIHGDYQRKYGGVDPGSTTTFVTGAVSALVGGILLLLSLR